MLIFSGNSNIPLAKKIASELNLELGQLEIITFPDNENRVRVVDRVLDQDVVVVQSTGVSPNLYYMELFFILDSLKRSGARSVTLVVPYLGYQRQDHIFRDGEAVSLYVIIKIIESLGVNRIISLDFHSIKIPQLFKIQVTHLSGLGSFAEKIKGIDKENLCLVSPDMGGIARVEKLSDLCGGIPTTSIVKNRDLDTGDIESVTVNGDVKKKAVIVDDVISTGKTLIAAAKLLEEKGVAEIWVMATHGIFANTASADLQNSNIKKVIITDTINIPDKRKFKKLEIVSIADLIAEEIRK